MKVQCIHTALVVFHLVHQLKPLYSMKRAIVTLLKQTLTLVSGVTPVLPVSWERKKCCFDQGNIKVVGQEREDSVRGNQEPKKKLVGSNTLHRFSTEEIDRRKERDKRKKIRYHEWYSKGKNLSRDERGCSQLRVEENSRLINVCGQIYNCDLTKSTKQI